jgi:hypothetical protein
MTLSRLPSPQCWHVCTELSSMALLAEAKVLDRNYKTIEESCRWRYPRSVSRPSFCAEPAVIADPAPGHFGVPTVHATHPVILSCTSISILRLTPTASISCARQSGQCSHLRVIFLHQCMCFACHHTTLPSPCSLLQSDKPRLPRIPANDTHESRGRLLDWADYKYGRIPALPWIGSRTRKFFLMLDGYCLSCFTDFCL